MTPGERGSAAPPAKLGQDPRAMRGMTLLEMMVAIGIFAVVGSAIYPILQGAMGSRRDATARVALAAEARMILDRLEQDLASSVHSGFQGPVPVRFVAAAPRSRDAERVLVELTTLVARGVTQADAPPREAPAGQADAPPAGADRGDLAQVAWRIDASGRLLRQEMRPPRIEPVEWEAWPVEVMSERATVALEFYEPVTWIDAWNSGETGAMRNRAPLAVRSTVRVGDADNDPIELVSTVVLPTIETASALRGTERGR